MKTLTSSKEKRRNNKEKKLFALLEIIKLNDQDSRHRHLGGTRNLDFSSCSIHSQTINNMGSNSSTSNNMNLKCSKRGADIPKNTEIEVNIKKPKYHGDSSSNPKTVIENNNNKRCQDDTPAVAAAAAAAAAANKTLNNNHKLFLPSPPLPPPPNNNNNDIIQKRLSRQIPKFRLKECGECAQLTVHDEHRKPIFLTDIQHLLMYALIGPESPCTPTRWCNIEKVSKLNHNIVLIVEGLSLFQYMECENEFTQINKIFENKLEIIMPNRADSEILQELATVPSTNAQKDALIEKYGSLELAIGMKRDPIYMVKTVFPINNNTDEIIMNTSATTSLSLPVASNHCNNDKFPRTQLLLSALQMVDEMYPLPLRGELKNKYSHYKFTKNIYDKVTKTSPLYGVDCEMCKTSLGIMELTRISIVNENCQPVYDTLVRPTNKIVDYLTQYSGITPDMMLNTTKTLQEVQIDIQNLLPSDAILVGQSLNIDLHALQMMHPYVIDTSIIFNLTGDRKRKSKLQVLAKTFLNEIIQNSNYGHDSVEDSASSLKLVKLKLENGLEFGDEALKHKTMRSQHYKQLNQDKFNITNNLFTSITSTTAKTSAIITSKNIYTNDIHILEGSCNDDPENFVKNPKSVSFYKTDSNKMAIKKVGKICTDHELTIANIEILPRHLESSRLHETITNIDKWISKLYEKLNNYGMFVLIFGETSSSNSGVAMINIKKDTPTTNNNND